MTLIGFLGEDGTATAGRPDPDAPRWRVYLTDRYGDPAPILAEMRQRMAPRARVPWASARNRDRAAAAAAEELDRPLQARTLRALRRHIGTTPYLEGNGFGILIGFSDEGANRFAGSDSVRDPRLWPHHLADLQRELADGLTPIPYASRKDRDRQANMIQANMIGDADEPPMPDADALIAHVAATP